MRHLRTRAASIPMPKSEGMIVENVNVSEESVFPMIEKIAGTGEKTGEMNANVTTEKVTEGIEETGTLKRPAQSATMMTMMTW